MIGKIKQTVKLVFSPQPDLSTPEGRGLDRYRRAARTSMAAILSRCVNIVTNIICVPLTLAYLGEESFGLWMALTSFMLFLTFSDLGLGVGLQNALADCHGRDDRDSPRYYVSSSLFVMILLFLMFVGVAVFVLPLIDLRKLVTVHDEATAAQLLPTAQAMLIAFGFGLPAGMIQRIYNAYQRGYWGYIQLATGSALALIGVLLCIHYRLRLSILALVFAGTPFLVPLIGGVVLFWRQRWLRPALSRIRRDHAKRIFSTGITAMGAQLAAMIMVAGPPLVIAHRIGTSAVTPLALSQKMLGAMTMVLTMSVWSLWPAYSEAAARGDWAWVRRTFRHTVKLAAVVITPVFLIVALGGQGIIGVWARKPEAVPTWSLLMAWNVWTLLRAWNMTCRIMLSGLSRMLGQATYGIVFGLAGVAAAYFVAPSYGVAGAVWAVVIVGEGLRACGLSFEVALVMRKHRELPSEVNVNG